MELWSGCETFRNPSQDEAPNVCMTFYRRNRSCAEEAKCVGICGIQMRQRDAHVDAVHVAEESVFQKPLFRTEGVNGMVLMGEKPGLGVDAGRRQTGRFQTIVRLVGNL